MASTTAKLSKEQIQEYREAFDMFDDNGDGKISRDELRTMMTSLGQQTTEEEISSIMARADNDGSGFIEFDEFVAVMAAFMPEDESEQLRQAFAMIDHDGSGKISSVELKKVLQSLGEKHISNSDVDEIVREIDMDGDGQIDYEEFIRMMKGRE